MVKISKEDLAKLAIGWGVANFLTKGALERPIQTPIVNALTRAGPAIGRAIIRYGPAAVGTAARVTPTGAVLSTAALLALQNRELIRDAAGNVYERVQPGASEYLGGVGERMQEFVTDPQEYIDSIGGLPFRPSPGKGLPGRIFKKRKKSAFNKAVSKGMSILKKSTSFGAKGKITNAKKAFTTVTKVASMASKKKKTPKSGIRRKLYLGMKGLFR